MAVAWLVDEAADEARGIEGDRRLWVVRAFGLDPSSSLVVDDPANPFDARDADGGALAEAVGVARAQPDDTSLGEATQDRSTQPARPRPHLDRDKLFVGCGRDQV